MADLEILNIGNMDRILRESLELKDKIVESLVKRGVN